MTSSPTQPLTDEQRIASLECELVTMRGLLEQAVKVLESPEMKSMCTMEHIHGREYKGPYLDCDAARSALSSSDLAGKVVVDRKLIDQVCTDLSCARGSVTAENKHRWIVRAYARLDSLRKGGGE